MGRELKVENSSPTHAPTSVGVSSDGTFTETRRVKEKQNNSSGDCLDALDFGNVVFEVALDADLQCHGT